MKEKRKVIICQCQNLGTHFLYGLKTASSMYALLTLKFVYGTRQTYSDDFIGCHKKLVNDAIFSDPQSTLCNGGVCHTYSVFYEKLMRM